MLAGEALGQVHVTIVRQSANQCHSAAGRPPRPCGDARRTLRRNGPMVRVTWKNGESGASLSPFAATCRPSLRIWTRDADAFAVPAHRPGVVSRTRCFPMPALGLTSVQ